LEMDHQVKFLIFHQNLLLKHQPIDKGPTNIYTWPPRWERIDHSVDITEYRLQPVYCHVSYIVSNTIYNMGKVFPLGTVSGHMALWCIDWLTPKSRMVGSSLLIGYLLLNWAPCLYFSPL
jgi:hypothetical protein